MKQRSQFPKSLKRKYKAAIDTAEKEKSAAAGGLSMNCSKTIDFFSELKRVCDSRAECTAGAADKEQCPLFAFCRRTLATQRAEEIIRAIESLQKWSNEHSRKTYAQDFFEKLPKAKMTKEGVPKTCRVCCYGGRCQYFAVTGVVTELCKDCWNEEMEAANDE